MSTTEYTEPGPVKDIASDGDVVLVVGLEKTRLRVYSQCLRSASKVFRVMLGPNWSQGQEMSSQSPREIALEEDDADAMRLICSIIHHLNDDVMEVISAKEILQVAIEVDKYDLNVTFQYARRQLLKPRGDESVLDMGYLMAAAFLFCDMDAFVARNLDLVFRFREPYLVLLDDETISQIVPSKTFYLLAERRTKARAEVAQILIEGKNRGCECGWAGTSSKAFAFGSKTRAAADENNLR
ncbi:hypothetical protein AK830_g2019 [Neonectria ditissima]|uniref:BTB domain-containing protein n=1 Tax=Neonectria ditissima TaxID=78410 RepID=A0A0P7BCN6_9HYPO|nr:hypothetical protein AK830_g2019 [Neonectria ditissima]